MKIERRKVDLCFRYPVLYDVVRDIITKEDIDNENMIVHVSLVYEYLHIVFILHEGESNVSVILTIEDLYDSIGRKSQELGREFSNLAKYPIVIQIKARDHNLGKRFQNDYIF